MHFNSILPNAIGRSRVILASILVLLTVSKASATSDHVARLNAPVDQLRMSPTIRGWLEQSATNVLKKRLEQASLYSFLSQDFYKRFHVTGARSTGAKQSVQTFFADAGYPMNLSHAEMELLFQSPQHPVFKRLDEDFDSDELREFVKNHRLFFVIDAVKLLKEPRYGTSPWAGADVIEDLKEQVQKHLGQSYDVFSARAENADRERGAAPRKPTLAECERIMDTMTNDELHRTYLRIMHRRLNPDDDQKL